jgi:hypothetical protein
MLDEPGRTPSLPLVSRPVGNRGLISKSVVPTVITNISHDPDRFLWWRHHRGRYRIIFPKGEPDACSDIH